MKYVQAEMLVMLGTLVTSSNFALSERLLVQFDMDHETEFFVNMLKHLSSEERHSRTISEVEEHYLSYLETVRITTELYI